MPYTLQDEVVLCGGNFWNVQSVFSRLPGVLTAVAGYAGGSTSHPSYHDVGDHVEAVHVVYDQRLISFADLLAVYGRLIEAPSQEHRLSFRILYTSEDQRKCALRFVRGLSHDAAECVAVEPLGRFWTAEDYHQNYLAKLQGGT